MTLYTNLRHNYDKNIIKNVRKYAKANKSKAKLKTTLTFLIECRKAGLIPKFITNSTNNVEQLFHFNDNLQLGTTFKIKNLVGKYVETFQLKILNLIIKLKHEELKQNQKELDNNRTYIRQNILEEDYRIFQTSENVLYESILNEKTKTKIKKFRELETIQNKRTYIKYNKDWFINKTNVEIPSKVQKLLSLGPKFALPIKKQQFPLFKCIADGEDIIQTNSERERQDIARTKFIMTMDNYFNKRSLTTRERDLISTVDEAKKFLNKNRNILILEADKGNTTVAVEKDDYQNKMRNMVQDMCTYKRLKTDPTSKLQTRNNTLVEKLHKLNIIDTGEKYKLMNNVATAPRIYGLPKVHKDGMPLRPICSSINSPAYELCRYIINILKNLTNDSQYNVRDAMELKQKLKNTVLSDDEVLVSFDVVSLFPSIPVNLALDIIMQKWEILATHTNIPKDLFTDILIFCIKDNRYFKYSEHFFQQLRGMPMGSPASPVIADIVMEQLLDSIMGSLNYKPRFMSKYVDDLFCIIKKDMVNETLKALNSFHRRIQFTMELEQNERLPYLDALIIRQHNTISIDWYKKATASGRIINFYSCHPKHVKLNTAHNFAKRILQISDTRYHKENTKKIQKILKQNSFSNIVIKKLIKDAKKNLNKTSVAKPEKTFKSMTHIPGFSERIIYSNIFDRQNVNIALKTDNTLKKLFSNTKSKVDPLDKSNVIYKIPCNGNGSNACNKIYVGTTKSKLRTRLAAHKSDYKTRKGTTEQKTALAAHCAITGHSPNITGTTILQQENNYKKRFTIEMLHIINTPTNTRMNYKTDTENCAHTYRHIIAKHKQKNF